MKKNLLEADEWDYLTKHFHLCENPSLRLGGTISAVDLLDEDKCREYLDQMTEHIQSPSRKVTASLLSKRYAFLTVAPSLYAMTMYNKGLELSMGNCRLILSEERNDSWLSKIGVSTLEVSSSAEESGSRTPWRDYVLQSLFAEHLAPIWRSISKVAHVPMLILWENTAVRLFSLYEKRMRAEDGSEIQSRIQDDFAYLVQKAPGAVFGEDNNPFTVFYDDEQSATASNRPSRTRKTCCYYYKIAKSEDFCTACPRAKSR